VKGVTIPRKVRLVANRFLTRCIHQYNVVGVLAHLSIFRLPPPFFTIKSLIGTGLEPFHDHYILIFNTLKNTQ